MLWENYDVVGRWFCLPVVHKHQVRASEPDDQRNDTMAVPLGVSASSLQYSIRTRQNEALTYPMDVLPSWHIVRAIDYATVSGHVHGTSPESLSAQKDDLQCIVVERWREARAYALQVLLSIVWGGVLVPGSAAITREGLRCDEALWCEWKTKNLSGSWVGVKRGDV